KRAFSESSSSQSSLTVSEKPEIDFSAERPYCISSLIESEESSVLHSYPQIGILHNFLYSKKRLRSHL
ncbi:hypothetical protein, partial [Paenibacillus alginolyticus]